MKRGEVIALFAITLIMLLAAHCGERSDQQRKEPVMPKNDIDQKQVPEGDIIPFEYWYVPAR